MIISIRNEISKSFFFIISSLLPIRSWQVLNSLVFPNKNYTIYGNVKTSEQVKILEQNFVIHAMLILVSDYYCLFITCKKSYSTSSSHAPYRYETRTFQVSIAN